MSPTLLLFVSLSPSLSLSDDITPLPRTLTPSPTYKRRVPIATYHAGYAPFIHSLCHALTLLFYSATRPAVIPARPPDHQHHHRPPHPNRPSPAVQITPAVSPTAIRTQVLHVDCARRRVPSRAPRKAPGPPEPGPGPVHPRWAPIAAKAPCQPHPAWRASPLRDRRVSSQSDIARRPRFSPRRPPGLVWHGPSPCFGHARQGAGCLRRPHVPRLPRAFCSSNPQVSLSLRACEGPDMSSNAAARRLLRLG